VPDRPEAFTTYAREIERELKLRYGGAMIADVNQVLTYGGVFAYPELESSPEGKLRLQFEANPMAYVMQAAGGASTDGTRSLLDVEPTSLHQRTPMYVGNTELIKRREAV
jgi:fructose-1,6-bisphosphatase I